jgi:hypothetical protein
LIHGCFGAFTGYRMSRKVNFAVDEKRMISGWIDAIVSAM